MSLGVAISLGSVVAVVLLLVSVYSRLMTLRNRFKTAFGQIDVQLKRRYDVIPSLVEASQGMLMDDRELLMALAPACDVAMDAAQRAASDPESGAAIRQLASAESGLSAALRRLLVALERSPGFSADATLRELLEALRSSEGRLAEAREAYNAAVATYNGERRRFPAVMVAGGLGFSDAARFELPAAAEGATPPTSVGS